MKFQVLFSVKSEKYREFPFDDLVKRMFKFKLNMLPLTCKNYLGGFINCKKAIIENRDQT